MSERKTIVLFPGMGADHRLFHKLRDAHQIVPLDLIRHEPHWRLADYARRYIELGLCRPGMTIGGTSMGGMLALEIAKQMPVERVLLIASCRSIAGINPALRGLSPLARVFPFGGAAKIPDTRILSRDHRLLLDMARRTRPDFFRWSCREIMRWDGYAGPVEIRSLHGTRDFIMPIRLQSPDETVIGGGHFLTLSHPEVVSAFVDRNAII